ncbi:hypothetical protein DNTS_008493 [Danionella cerebrum]|uniref:Scavenger receptor class B member 1 n=1 Tax=Danionella cerebrum TaxID=2873325 RepID=A0A553PUK6_9TELE|nr:hypothetical protein DNTS_008493 [Danionella translucida]
MAATKSTLSLVFLVLGALGVLFGTVLVFVGPIIIDDQIVKNVEINPKNDLSYTMWKDIPVPFFMSVYFLHIVNPDEILKGEKPVVMEQGPYVYRENRWKDNITFHENATVSYKEYRQYFFEESMSVGNESDVVTIPNMLVLGASVMMENAPLAVRVLVSSTFKSFNEGAFITKPVGELMWGYESKLVDFLNKFLPGLMPSSGKFGLFSEFNNSNTGLFTIFTGRDDIRNVHMVDTWNGQKKVDYWSTGQCNMINGTAGQMWPPFMTKETTMPFYSPDACRIILRTKASVPVDSPGCLMSAPADTPPEFESHVLYSPSFISQPHFYNADPELLKTVDGLNPSEEEHGLFIDIHPETGVPINVSVRLQLNLLIKRVPGISETGNIKELVIPMLWFEESGYIDGPVLNTFRTNLVLLPMVMEYMQYIFIAVGLIFLLTALVLFLRHKVKHSMNTCYAFIQQLHVPDAGPEVTEGCCVWFVLQKDRKNSSMSPSKAESIRDAYEVRTNEAQSENEKPDMSYSGILFVKSETRGPSSSDEDPSCSTNGKTPLLQNPDY